MHGPGSLCAFAGLPQHPWGDMHFHLRVLTAVAGAAALALAGLAPAMPASAATTRLALDVTLIGDSYSAGNGAGNYEGPLKCYRSPDNWGEQYADTLRDRFTVKVVNRACSGATIDDVETKNDQVKSHFHTHEPDGRVCCENDDRWVNEFDSFTKYEYYHYNKRGHQEIKNLLVSKALALGGGTSPSGSVDIAFVVDTTGSMGSAISNVKAAATELVNTVSSRTSAAISGWPGQHLTCLGQNGGNLCA